jgi:hypothetical protein
MDAKSQALLDHLINQGAIQISDIDSNGEIVYSITDKLQEVHPELYMELKDEFEHNMFEMINQGPRIMTWRIRAK